MESELTCTWYCKAAPLGLVEAFHCKVTLQELEQVPLGSVISTGVEGTDADKVKLSTVDHADTLVVVTASRACTRQYHVPFANIGV